jgi:hypothetical protein
MASAIDCASVGGAEVGALAELDIALQTRFENTNRAIAADLNPHFKLLAGRAFRVSTPKQDEEESEPLRHFFPERHYVPLIEILATVNLHTEFATELRHLRQTHVRQVSEKILFAGVIGLGCAIGSTKMAQISSSLSAAELDSAINWRFSLENLCAANGVPAIRPFCGCAEYAQLPPEATQPPPPRALIV